MRAMAAGRSEHGLLGRRAECRALDQLVADVAAGRSAALVLRGETGIGKTALLRYLAERAAGCRVVRVTGVESEMELAFAGLHQLCAQLPGGLTGPRHAVLASALGPDVGPSPDRFRVGIALLDLLAEAAEDRPLICLIDDAEWLDQVSTQALAFVARRLGAERLALVFAAGESDEAQDLAGLPVLPVAGLGYADARAMLDSATTGVVDVHVRERFLTEARGNPLALLELSHVLSGQLAGGFGLYGTRPLPQQLEAEFLRRFWPLPPGTRLVVLLAAAEPVGDAGLLWLAAERLGIEAEAAVRAESAGLIEIGAGVRFRHPLLRSAIYRASSAEDRRRVHGALAEVTDADRDPDRRAWHRAYAVVGPDEAVAAELENAAQRAQARGGVAAAAAFLERAVELTPKPGRRAERSLAAAGSKFAAGESDAAHNLLAVADLGPLDPLQRAHLARLRARLVFARERSSAAVPLLLAAADQLKALGDPSTRETYLEALGAAIFAGRLEVVEQAAAAARAAGPAPSPAGPMDLLLDGVAMRFTDGYEAAIPLLRAALRAFREDSVEVTDGVVRWLWLACPVAPEPVASELWDDDVWHELATRAVEFAREVGALGILPVALSYRAAVQVHAGEFAAASTSISESDSLAAATGNAPLRYARLLLAGWRGEETAGLAAIRAGLEDAAARGEGRATALASHVKAVLYNGLSRYDEALDAATKACRQQDLGFVGWSLAELVEAAARAGVHGPAAEALKQLEQRTLPAGTDWALGILARSRALLTEGPAAEALYREAIQRLGRTRVVVHLARAHLVYGEWLRREQRRQDARLQLRLAYDRLSEMGALAFAERARQELAATGEASRRPASDGPVLTAQEAQIAQLAAAGLTNQEIGGRLFLSHHTVEWHLRKVFNKLGVSSRRQLDPARVGSLSPVAVG
ncbi:helix-turn-helix transcriptional regulator [Kribbella sp. CA-293567]|uniref:helix-turn-helix transcriptional regulator n=1 Tax=Kribbella sp. CA-293567 TaxID=3002436 RepID=UPI0022DE0F9C|nr:LuxR family transcriptional regulator [Kribbella sp. CA-293567]WBQ03622.1 AAA family ATPase [Kribbella sp. CA-293567]